MLSIVLRAPVHCCLHHIFVKQVPIFWNQWASYYSSGIQDKVHLICTWRTIIHIPQNTSQIPPAIILVPNYSASVETKVDGLSYQDRFPTTSEFPSARSSAPAGVAECEDHNENFCKGLITTPTPLLECSVEGNEPVHNDDELGVMATASMSADRLYGHIRLPRCAKFWFWGIRESGLPDEWSSMRKLLCVTWITYRHRNRILEASAGINENRLPAGLMSPDTVCDNAINLLTRQAATLRTLKWSLAKRAELCQLCIEIFAMFDLLNPDDAACDEIWGVHDHTLLYQTKHILESILVDISESMDRDRILFGRSYVGTATPFKEKLAVGSPEKFSWESAVLSFSPEIPTGKPMSSGLICI